MTEDTLNESEREAIENAWIIAPKDGPSGDDDPMYRAVEQIVAARTAALACDRDALAAKAWDQGYIAGHSNAMRRMSDEPNAPTSPNPYLAGPEDTARDTQRDNEGSGR